MKAMIVWHAAAVLATLARIAPTGAQLTLNQSAGAARWVPVVAGVVHAPVLQRRVTLDLSGASMADALRAIAGQIDGQLMYDASIVSLSAHVTMRMDGTVDQALHAVLAGMPVQVFVSGSGDLVLLKRLSRHSATGIVRGHVTDASSGAPLGDVLVSIAGTLHTTVSGVDGAYVLSGLPPGPATVRAQRIGYAPVESRTIVVDDESVTVDFALGQAAVSLDQVVVTAAGSERRKEEGSSLTSLDASEFRNAPVVSPQDALQGRVPGLTILSNGGAPGAGGTIRLRGVNSISESSTPIIYVDGVRVYNELIPAGYGGRQGYLPLNDISADDIDHFEIIKGAAATALYGTEASAGVIQIMTKRGRAGRSVWEGETGQGFSAMGHVGSSTDPTGQFMNQCRGPNLVNSDGAKFADPTCPASGSWFRNGEIQHYNGSVRGGGDRVNYFFSGNFADEYSTLATGQNRNGGFRSNVAFTPGTAPFELSFNTSYTRRSTRWAPEGNNSEGLTLNASRGNQGYLVAADSVLCARVPASTTCVTNGLVFRDNDVSNADHFTSGLTLTHNPGKPVTNRLTVGYDFNSNAHQTYVPFGFPTTPGGYLYDEQRQHSRLTAEYAGTWRANATSWLTSALSWGGQAFRDQDKFIENDGSFFSGPGTPLVSSAGVITLSGDSAPVVVNAGLFVQELVGLSDRLFVTGAIRVDGNSAFGGHYGLQAYPKVSVAYTLSGSSWWPRWFEVFKMRAALGTSGRQPGAFDKLQTFVTAPGVGGVAGFLPAQLGNSKLGPERTTEMELGFDASVWNGRVGLEATYYRDRVDHALIGASLAPSLGFQAQQPINAGTLRNSGFELHATLTPIRARNVVWDWRVNASWLSSRAVDIPGGSVYTFLNTYVKVGYPVPNYFGYKITNPNAIADPIISNGNSSLGAQYPDRLYGIGTTVTVFARLSLDAVADAQLGGHLANYTALRDEIRGTWYPCYAVQRALNKFAADANPADLAGINAFQRGRCSQDGSIADIGYWTEKTDFIKLRSVSLTYSLPRGWIGRFAAASISVAARNFATWTKYDGADPEVQDVADARAGSTVVLGRRDYYNLPLPRTFLATVRLTY